MAAGYPGRISSKSETKLIVRRLVKEKGLDPLDVMLDNMNHAYTEACDLRHRKDKKSKQDFRGAVNRAQAAAADAAPYVHPKLASTTLKGDPNAPLAVQFIDDIKG